jgi:hypothetical protein
MLAVCLLAMHEELGSDQSTRGHEEGTYAIEYAVDAAEKSLPIHVVHGLPSEVELPGD